MTSAPANEGGDDDADDFAQLSFRPKKRPRLEREMPRLNPAQQRRIEGELKDGTLLAPGDAHDYAEAS
jgi:hypothetical protein